MSADRLADLREDYTRGGLDEADAGPDPMVVFASWLAEAVAARDAGLAEPNAIVVATVDADGHPDARTVLLKGLDTGFVFFTNHDSAKGRQLDADPRCALTFGWLALERQVRVRGVAERIVRDETEAYFATRPRGSQLGAWASPQSSVVADRAELEASYAATAARFGGAEGTGSVPAPPHWGGYRVIPDELEFWQGRPGRMHDRLRYRRSGEGWLRERLAP